MEYSANGTKKQEDSESIINRLIEESNPETKKVEFSPDIIWNLTGMLLTDLETVRMFRSRLSPSQMQEQAQKVLVEIAYAYYDKYQAIPTEAIYKEEILQRYPNKSNGLADPMASIARGALNTAKQFYIPGLDERAYLHDKLNDYCERTSIVRAMNGLLPHYLSMKEFKEKAARVLEDILTPKESKNYSFKPLTSQEFKDTQYRMEWAIEGLLVRDQPFILAGPKKSLKTSLLVDLVLSLGSATPFLGKFRVPKAIKTAFISGESGEYTIKETVLRVCAAKGIDLADTLCGWDFRLPRLSVATDLLELVKGLRDQGYEIIIIDPLYLCLLNGAKDKQASNLFDMGPIFMEAVSACKRGGAQVGLAHHTIKHLKMDNEPMQMEDMAFAGCAEFARQWIMVNRREKYDPGTGRHELWLQSGGSVGHGGLWGLDIHEGVLQPDFSGRTWKVNIMNLEEIKIQKSLQKDETIVKKDIESETLFLAALDSKSRPPAKTVLGEELGWSHPKFKKVVDALVRKKIIELFDGEIEVGNGAKRKAKLIQRT